MFSNTKILGYFILLLPVILLILMAYYDLGLLFIITIGLLLVNFDSNIIGIALELIELNLYVGDKISVYTAYDNEEEDYFLEQIDLFKPTLNRGDLILVYSSWAQFLQYSIGYLDTKAHSSVSKRVFQRTFYFYFEDLSKIIKMNEFIIEMEDRLKKEKSFEKVWVEDAKNCIYCAKDKEEIDSFVNIQKVVVSLNINAGRENWDYASFQTSIIAIDIVNKLNLNFFGSKHKIVTSRLY